MPRSDAVRNILWDWQSLQPYVGPNATFFQSCDAIEVMNGVSAPATGWGLDQALSAWGAYFKNVYLPQCQVTLCRFWESVLIAILRQYVAPILRSMPYLKLTSLLTNSILLICCVGIALGHTTHRRRSGLIRVLTMLAGPGLGVRTFLDPILRNFIYLFLIFVL